MTDRHAPQAAGARVRGRLWLAFTAPATAWFVFEIGLAGALRLSCTAVGAGLGVAWGVASLTVCAAAAWLVRPAAAPPGRPWLARIARLQAALFALAIAFQTLATLVVPPCAR